MKTDFLDYQLPLELIAQQPCPERDQPRLLVTRRAGPSLEHRVFHDLPDLFSSEDLLVLNDTRVLPARLLGRVKPRASASYSIASWTSDPRRRAASNPAPISTPLMA